MTTKKETLSLKWIDAHKKLLDTCEKLKLDSATKTTTLMIYHAYPNYWYSKPLMGASIYIALYKNNHPPIPQNTIADILGTDGNSISRMSKMIQEKQNINLANWKHIASYEKIVTIDIQDPVTIAETINEILEEIRKRDQHTIKIKITTQKEEDIKGE